MLNIKTQSENVVTVVGTLSELKIEQGKSTKTGKEYVSGQAKIAVDQEIKGTVTHNVITVKMFANKVTKEGRENKIYNDILGYAESFTSLAAAEDPADASRVSVTGKLEENTWKDKKTDRVINDFVVSSNFLNFAKKDVEDTAIFRMTGVVLKMTDVEYENESPKKHLEIGVVKYNGTLDILPFETINDLGTDFVSSNWNKGDTVAFTGIINSSFTVKEEIIEQAFGKPIVKRITNPTKKLYIDGGANPLEEAKSYDAGEIKLAMDERQERIAATANSTTTPTKAAKPEVDFF